MRRSDAAVGVARTPHASPTFGPLGRRQRGREPQRSAVLGQHSCTPRCCGTPRRSHGARSVPERSHQGKQATDDLAAARRPAAEPPGEREAGRDGLRRDRKRKSHHQQTRQAQHIPLSRPLALAAPSHGRARATGERHLTRSPTRRAAEAGWLEAHVGRGKGGVQYSKANGANEAAQMVPQGKRASNTAGTRAPWIRCG